MRQRIQHLLGVELSENRGISLDGASSCGSCTLIGPCFSSELNPNNKNNNGHWKVRISMRIK